MKMGEQISRKNDPLISEWIKEQKIKNNGLICELLPILSASVTEGYRNKCEFTIGKSRDEGKIIIGFRMAAYATGSTSVGPIQHLCHIPESMKKAVKVNNNYNCNKSIK